MLNLLLLVIGDVLLTILTGFYAGVGIRESAGLFHISAMSVPTLLVWLLSATLFNLYPSAAEINRQLSAERKGNAFKRLNSLLDNIISLQRVMKLLAVWLISSLFAIFWQAYYWNSILESSFRHGLFPQLFFWYCSACAAFFIFWRFCWSAFVALRQLSRTNKTVRTLCVIILILIALYQVPAIYLTICYAPQKMTLQAAGDNLPDTAIVFAAGVYQNGQPSKVLSDRVDTAIDLYKEGKISRMIMSGDNSTESRHEVDVMNQLALAADIPSSAIVRDGSGLHTAESCYNAHNIYGLDRAIMISQDFHTTRILYICDHYEVDGVAISADRSVYNIFSWMSWHLRDWLGLTLYWLNFTFSG